MSKLYQLLQQDAVILENSIVKVDSFLNHQMNIELFEEIRDQFYEYFKDKKIDKIITCEASGIGIAIMVAQAFRVNVVFAKKDESQILTNNCYTAPVFSYTKNKESVIKIDKRFIQANENILIIDDFLANGEAVAGLINIVQQAHAHVRGIGIVIEKGFQQGGQRLREKGFDLYSLAIIDAIIENQLIMRV
ncbi:MAG: xanthine phosphoribosyltransferase [Erysipelothrix sp.]|nr:xanthine phosphoribosyltransferase [Erysipelothrix sp.]